MPVPKHIFAPPFNIVRSSHVTLGVADLGRSRAFYEGTLGLQVEDETGDALYLRGLEERQHHSLVLQPVSRTGRAASRLQGRQRGGPRQGRAPLQGAGHASTPSSRHRSRAARCARSIRAGCRSSSTSRWTNARPCSAQYGRYKGVQPQRLDHFNVFAPEVQRTDRLLCLARLPPHRVRRGGRRRRAHRGGLDAPQGQRARPRLHQRRRPAPASSRLLGAERAQHHPPVRRDGLHRLPGQHGARARPARHLQRLLPVRALPRRPPHRDLHVRLPDHGPRPRAPALEPARSAPADPVGPAGPALVVRGRLAVRRRRRRARHCSRPTCWLPAEARIQIRLEVGHDRHPAQRPDDGDHRLAGMAGRRCRVRRRDLADRP